MSKYEGLCPACHHQDHDPGGCGDCPRCELHYDEAIRWLRRNRALPDTGLDVERLTVALAATMDPTAYEHRNDEGYGGHAWPKEWRKALSWARQFTEGQAAEYARLTEEK